MTQRANGRARRWVWVLGYVVLVLASTPFTPGLTALFEGSRAGHALLVAVPLLAVAAVIAAPAAVASRRRQSRGNVAFWAAIGALYLLVWIILCERAVEGIHLAQYGLLSMLAFRAVHGLVPLPAAYGLSAALAVTVSCMNEVVQGFLPNRVYDLRDIVLDAVAGALGLIVVWQARLSQ